MVERSDIGSWLSGPPRVDEPGHYPGRLIGLPEEGPGSIATFGRRLAAFLTDGVIAQIIAMGVFGYRQGEGGVGVFTPTLVFLVMHLLLVATGGSTIGHRLLGMRVEAAPRGWAGPRRALVRTALMCLVIPMLISDRDERGLHDRLAGTILVRTR